MQFMVALQYLLSQAILQITLAVAARTAFIIDKYPACQRHRSPNFPHRHMLSSCRVFQYSHTKYRGRKCEESEPEVEPISAILFAYSCLYPGYPRSTDYLKPLRGENSIKIP